MNASFSPIQTQWPAPLSAKEWDQRFPGVMDSIGLLGAAANIIMQLALAPVGHGVAESKVHSGSIFHHPIKRTRTTLTYLAVAMLGNSEEKQAYRNAVNRSHAQVRSDDNSPVKYNAFSPELQLWVAACLYWGYADIMEKFWGGLSREQAEIFYRLAEPLGTTLQVRPEMWPKDLTAFEEYWQQTLPQLHIDDRVRQMLTDIADLKFLPRPFSALLGPFNRFVTVGFLPAEVREQMHFDWSSAQQRRFERLLAVVGGVNRLMPRVLRQAPTLLFMADFRRRQRKGLPMV
ncbi:MAG: oxygenase MpaB family protein [Alcanivoracaceae bacterium]